MSAAPLPPTEDERTSTLLSLGLLDTAPERMFEDLVALATELSGCPIALVSLVDQDRQWFKAKVGLDACETPRDLAFCSHAILRPQVMWIEDARQDPRFWDNPLVTGAPFIRFYGGAPITVDGDRIGTVCVIDREPRSFDQRLADLMVRLASMAAERMEARREASLLAGVIDHSPDAVLTVNVQGRILRWNPAAERLFGFSAEEAIGQTLDLITPETTRSARSSQLSAMMEGGLLDRPGVPIEMLGLCKSGGEVPLEATFAVQDFGGQVTLTALMRDGTDRKQRENALAAALHEAEAGSRAKGEFLANMSHEIRTPLNGVIGMAQAMSHDRLPRKQRERLQVVLQSGKGLLTLLNNFLDLSKIEAGMLEIEIVEFDLGDTIRNACAPFELIAERKGVGLTVKVEDGVGRRLGDAARLGQIVLNLVSNAVKFTDEGKVEVRVSAEGDNVRIRVSDTGLGMSAATTRRVFENFVQADASTTRRFGGTGLGLAICRALSEMMGGSLVVESEPDNGSVFFLGLSLPQVETEQASCESSQQLADKVSTLRVLAAEDNHVNQLVLTTLLGQIGIGVMVANNGLEAVEAWRREPWDVILMDIQMPVMDGPTATTMIRAAEAAEGRRRTPIVALTANAMAHQVAEYLAAGMDAVVSKPISVEKLFNTLEAVLSSADQLVAEPEVAKSAA